MLFQRKVKAGVLLYALLMLAVLTLFLQFYNKRVTMVNEVQIAYLENTQAHLIAGLTANMVKDKKGEFHFNHGMSYYQQIDEFLEVDVSLSSGAKYHYQLPFVTQVGNDLEASKDLVEGEDKKSKE